MCSSLLCCWSWKTPGFLFPLRLSIGERQTNNKHTTPKKKKVRGGASVLFLPLKLGADADGEVASPQGS